MRFRNFSSAFITLSVAVNAFDLLENSSPYGIQDSANFSIRQPGAGFVDPNSCTVDDGCDKTISTIDELNAKVRDKVKTLVQSDFFKYFKLELYKSCPFWPENPMCFSSSCAVEIEEDSLDIDYSLTGDCDPKKKLVEYNCDYCNTSEENSDDAVFVDLTLNPERFSGYGGEESRRIWNSIYQENCFNKPLFEEKLQDQTPFFNNKYLNFLSSWSVSGASKTDKIKDLLDNDQCLEKRVFYRLISGMHASIATHLSFEWLNIQKKNAKFEPNLNLFMERVGYFGERLSNIYFNYSLVIKAILKLDAHLKEIRFSTDNHERELINDIVKVMKPHENSLFNENLLFNYEDDLSNQLLKNEFKNNFKNVSTLMDCVGCERCRLWGKVQTLGYGTSLKILFELNNNNDFDVKSLKRSEIVALVNTFDRLSKSVEAINYFRQLYNAEGNLKDFEQFGDDDNDSLKLMAYQQKIFKEYEEEKEEKTETLGDTVVETVAVPEKVQQQNVDNSKKQFKQIAKQDRDQVGVSHKSGIELEDSEELEKLDDSDLTPEEIRYKRVFKNSLRLKNSKRPEDKVLNDHFMEVLEEFKDAFRFLWESYVNFPRNLYIMAMTRLEFYWNYYIGNDEFFLTKYKAMHSLS